MNTPLPRQWFKDQGFIRDDKDEFKSHVTFQAVADAAYNHGLESVKRESKQYEVKWREAIDLTWTQSKKIGDLEAKLKLAVEYIESIKPYIMHDHSEFYENGKLVDYANCKACVRKGLIEELRGVK